MKIEINESCYRERQRANQPKSLYMQYLIFKVRDQKIKVSTQKHIHPHRRIHSLVLTIVIYTLVVINCTASTLEENGGKNKQKGRGRERTKTTTSFLADWGSFLSQHRFCYFILLLKLKDRCSSEFLAFIQPVVQWITRQ